MKTLYYHTQDRNGTEDEILIHAPDGTEMACIWFWDQGDERSAAIKADAQLIVDAINAYPHRRRRRLDVPVTSQNPVSQREPGINPPKQILINQFRRAAMSVWQHKGA